MKVFLALALLSALVAGCQSPSEPPAPQQQPQQQQESSATQVQEYKLDGEIVSVDKEKKTAVIKHEEIVGLMAAMTMSYPIPEQADIDKIKPGDHITATVYDQPAEARIWLGNIQVANTPHP